SDSSPRLCLDARTEGEEWLEGVVVRVARVIVPAETETETERETKDDGDEKEETEGEDTEAPPPPPPSLSLSPVSLMSLLPDGTLVSGSGRREARGADTRLWVCSTDRRSIGTVCTANGVAHKDIKPFSLLLVESVSYTEGERETEGVAGCVAPMFDGLSASEAVLSFKTPKGEGEGERERETWLRVSVEATSTYLREAIAHQMGLGHTRIGVCVRIPGRTTLTPIPMATVLKYTILPKYNYETVVTMGLPPIHGSKRLSVYTLPASPCSLPIEQDGLLGVADAAYVSTSTAGKELLRLATVALKEVGVGSVSPASTALWVGAVDRAGCVVLQSMVAHRGRPGQKSFLQGVSTVGDRLSVYVETLPKGCKLPLNNRLPYYTVSGSALVEWVRGGDMPLFNRQLVPAPMGPDGMRQMCHDVQQGLEVEEKGDGDGEGTLSLGEVTLHSGRVGGVRWLRQSTISGVLRGGSPVLVLATGPERDSLDAHLTGARQEREKVRERERGAARQRRGNVRSYNAALSFQ
ncbi:hypothetical protein KIPB_010688, partial [Kipferlia bialata]